MDARTGRVLAWSEAPRYEPGAGVAGPLEDEEAAALLDRRGDALPGLETFDLRATPSAEASRVAQVAVEPGSALKPLTALFALSSDHPPPGAFSCAGPGHTANQKPGCHHAHGPLGFEEAMCVSCNRWFAWAVARPDVVSAFRASYPAFARSVGLGSRTGVDLLHEGAGLFRPEGEHSYRHLAIGQGPVLATPLQMARLAALVGNGGTLVTPRLAVSIGDRPVSASHLRVEVSPAVLAAVRRGMAAVVASDGGTAASAFRETPPSPGVSVFGKTGTAQVSDGGPFDPDRLAEGPWHHWFVGFAERGEERIAFAMVLYARTEAAAGRTAARAVARWLRWWFDRGPER
jgi:cell division protein FtsI/penicillin-binding protein 2